MAQFDKISINGVPYNVHDTGTANALSELENTVTQQGKQITQQGATIQQQGETIQQKGETIQQLGQQITQEITDRKQEDSKLSGQITKNKNRVFSVIDYGATGNGVTDDTASVKAAVSAAITAGGGCVYFPAGVYIISDTITIGFNLKICGAGHSSLIKCQNMAGKSLFYYRGKEESPTIRFILCDIKINGNGATFCVNFVNASVLRFQNVDVYNFDTGFLLNYGNNIVFYGCLIHDITAEGVFLGGTTTTGIGTQFIDGVSFYGCSFAECGTAGIYNLGGKSTATMVISGCQFYFYKSICGIWSAFTTGVIVEGCWFEMGDGKTGIYLSGYDINHEPRGKALGNTITASYFGNHGTRAIQMDGAHSTTITDCMFSGLTDYPVSWVEEPGLTQIGPCTVNGTKTVVCKNHKNIRTLFPSLIENYS